MYKQTVQNCMKAEWTYCIVAPFRIALTTLITLELLSIFNVRDQMLQHMFVQVAFLSKSEVTVGACEWSDVVMHTHMVQ